MDRFKLGLNVVKGAKSEAKQDRKKAIYFLSQKHPPKSLGGYSGFLNIFFRSLSRLEDFNNLRVSKVRSKESYRILLIGE